MLIAPNVSDYRTITLLDTFLLDREVFLPEGKILIDCPGPPDHFLLQLHGEGMSHVDHDAVYAERLLVIRYDVGYLLPERLVNIFFTGEPRIIHANRVVSNV